ncbi:hypothetical protein MRB53_039215 [Persea americana]|nr:hypothetical protein MRB53_039215 [Persea americana]
MNETLEQAGARNLQALLVNPNDALALHNMIKCFTASVKKQPSKSLTICPALDAAKRSLCAAAMKAQALISCESDEERLLYGADSLRRIKSLWSGGYNGVEDVGFWKNFILKPERQLDIVLKAYTALIKTPEAVHDYSQVIFVELADLWQPSHLPYLEQVEANLNATTQGEANLLSSEVTTLRRNLT